MITQIYNALQRYRESKLDAYLGRTDTLSVQNLELNVRGLSVLMKRWLVLGEFEKSEIEVARTLIRPGDRVLDVGAGLGFVGIFSATHLGAGRITGVEANPDTFQLLQDNYRRNKVDGECVNAAVADQDGVLRMIVGKDFWVDRVSSGNAGSTGAEREVHAISFESLFRLYGAEKDVLMLDVEGAEIHAVNTLVPAGIRCVVIEVHPELLSGDQIGEVTCWLTRQGFRLVCLSGRVLGFRRAEES